MNIHEEEKNTIENKKINGNNNFDIILQIIYIFFPKKLQQ